MKKGLVLSIILSIVCSFSAFAYESKGGKVILKYGELNPDNHVMTVVAKEFARIVKEKSKGSIIIDVYPSSQLGDERTMVQGLQMGAIDLMRANSVSLGDLGAKKMNIFALPYLFRDRAHLWTALSSPIGREILGDLQASKSGLVGVAYMEEGQRNFFFRNNPPDTIEKMKGKKIRVPQSEILLDTVKAFGANPTPISYSELYSALQTGIVDAAENPPTGYLSNNFYEVAKYYVIDGHTYSPGVVCLSEATWKKLSADQRKILSDAGVEMEKINRKLIEKADNDAFAALKAKGTQIIQLKDAQKWRDAVKPLYQRYGKDFLTQINKITSMK